MPHGGAASQFRMACVKFKPTAEPASRSAVYFSNSPIHNRGQIFQAWNPTFARDA
jgi:hypothetical protein